MTSRPDRLRQQQVLRRGPQDGHADAAHHTGARARDAGIRVLPTERAVVACSDGAAESLDERGEGLVDLAVDCSCGSHCPSTDASKTETVAKLVVAAMLGDGELPRLLSTP